MARASGETLATSWGKPCSLARYISPSNSSRIGQKSLSKASRLEDICISPDAKDAMRLSNERLTTVTGKLLRRRRGQLDRKVRSTISRLAQCCQSMIRKSVWRSLRKDHAQSNI